MNKGTNKGQPRHSVGGVSKRFKQQAELYRIFGSDWESCADFSDAALIELYNNESYGTPISSNNGFAIGKKFLNVQVTSWREDLEKGLIFKWELYTDSRFPHWWLDSVLDNSHDLSTIMLSCPRRFRI